MTLRIAGIFAHPDDAELWAGGTFIKHAQIGDAVHIMTFADQSGIRVKEAVEGAYRLGVQCEIGKRDILRLETRLRSALEDFLTRTKAEIVITHWTKDCHHEHRAIGAAALAAATRSRIDCGLPRSLLYCDTYASLGLEGPFSPSLFVDISLEFPLKLDAIKAHASQPTDRWVEMATTLGRLNGARSGCVMAEAFLRVPILGEMPVYNSLASVI